MPVHAARNTLVRLRQRNPQAFAVVHERDLDEYT